MRTRMGWEGSKKEGSRLGVRIWEHCMISFRVLYATGRALARRWVVEKTFISARLFAIHSLFQGKIN